MTSGAKLIVQAEGSVQVRPDRANLRFRAQTREGDRNRAVEKVRSQLALLSQTLDRFSVERHRRRTESITATQLIDPATKKRIGYEASAWVTVRLDTFDRLGELHHAVATIGDVDITGPTWEVSAVNPAHLEACSRAAATARRRAEAFAEGAGLALDTLVKLEEQHLSGRGAQMTAGYQQAAIPAAGAMDGGVIRLSVSVTAVYRLRGRDAAE